MNIPCPRSDAFLTKEKNTGGGLKLQTACYCVNTPMCTHTLPAVTSVFGYSSFSSFLVIISPIRNGYKIHHTFRWNVRKADARGLRTHTYIPRPTAHGRRRGWGGATAAAHLPKALNETNLEINRKYKMLLLIESNRIPSSLLVVR